MQNQDKNTILSTILVIGIIILGVILIKNGKPTETIKEPIFENKISIKPIDETDYILGNKDAKIIIVEYSDTECPYCKVFHNTMHQIVEKSNGKVAWVYRHFPIPALHQKAMPEAIATECAGELGGNDVFWQYLDEVFARTNSNDSLDLNELPKIAKELGLNEQEFQKCTTEQRHLAKIEMQIADGTQAGIRGTPSSFIIVDGKVVESIRGAQPVESVMDLIENANR